MSKKDKHSLESQYEYEEPSMDDFLQEEVVDPKEEARRRRRKRYIQIVGIIVIVTLVLQGAYTVIQMYSRDSLELVRTSEKLSDEQQIATWKEAVVTISGMENKGTGFVIHEDGFILTNHHVVHQKNPLAVILPDGDIYNATIIESNETIDIALLKVEGGPFPYLPIRSTSAKAGEEIVVIGNPLSQTQIVNKGEVLNEEHPFQVMKISAPIYPGHSGSPVLSEFGEVVAVVYARTIPSVRNKDDKYGLAVPVEQIITQLPMLDELIESY